MSTMGRLEFTTPREAWGGEASDFTPLLSEQEMLDYLGQEIGIGRLSTLETEHTTAGNRNLDILAETGDGRRVSIENQYGIGDHDHLTRGLAYAVATNSAALVVIAEEHRDEFISVADYLNEMAGLSEEGIQVWLVKVRAVRRKGDEIWSPEFVVMAAPNEWEAAVRRDTTPVLGSLEEFYEKCEENVDPAWEQTARTIIEDWVNRPGAREFHGNVSQVSLYYPSPRHGEGGTNILQVDFNGGFRVCRGYTWETSGVFPAEAEPEILDRAIRDHFPSALWVGQRYFIRVPGVEPRAVRDFADWLTEQFDLASRAKASDG